MLAPVSSAERPGMNESGGPATVCRVHVRPPSRERATRTRVLPVAGSLELNAISTTPSGPTPRDGNSVMRTNRPEPNRITFPHAPTVRFHLGLMLLWLGQIGQAETEFRRALAEGPTTVLGHEAKAFLVRLESIRTRRQNK